MAGFYIVWPPAAAGGGGGSGVNSIGSMDAQAASVNGAAVSGSTLYMQSASSASGGAGVGLVNTVAQAFLGTKTFVNAPIVSALAAASPVLTTGAGQLSAGSISLTNQVVNNLPLSQTSGSVSLGNQVSSSFGTYAPFSDGTSTNPGIAFANETNTGWYRSGTGDVVYMVNGVQGAEALKASATQVNWGFGGPGTVAGATNAPVYYLVNQNLEVYYTYGNISTSSAAATTFQISAPASAYLLFHNFAQSTNSIADNGSGNLNGGGGIFANVNLTKLFIGNDYAQGGVQAYVGGRTAGFLQFQVTSSVSIFYGGNPVVFVGSQSGSVALSATAGGSAYALQFPSAAGIVGKAWLYGASGASTWGGLNNMVGSISLTNQVVGNLPLSQTSGSISLTNQISGILPQGNLTLTPSFTQATIGSVTQTSSAGGNAYTVNWPGTQGSSVASYLVNNGSGALSWLVNSNKVTILSTLGSGSFIPQTNTTLMIAEGVGGGGAGGAASTGANAAGAGAGGNAGGYFKKFFVGSAILSVYAYTVGAGGPTTPAGLAMAGASGSQTSFGPCSGQGGGGGGGGVGVAGVSVSGSFSALVAGGSAGDLNIQGGVGLPGLILTATGSFAMSGSGGFSNMGAGGYARYGAQDGAGIPAGTGYGGGGGGGLRQVSIGSTTGGAGAQGVIIVYEFC